MAATVSAKVDEILEFVRSQKLATDDPRYAREPTPTERIDPTLNVKELVNLQMLRQDELRVAEARRVTEILTLQDKCAHEIAEIRLQAQKESQAAESRRIDALMLAESRRIDALLAAAANAVTLASTRQELTAGALAERVDTTAKAAAASVLASAEALSKQVAAQSSVFDARLTRLEQAGYETGGRDTQRLESRTSAQWTTGTIVSSMSAALAFISVLMYAFLHH